MRCWHNSVLVKKAMISSVFEQFITSGVIRISSWTKYYRLHVDAHDYSFMILFLIHFILFGKSLLALQKAVLIGLLSKYYKSR